MPLSDYPSRELEPRKLTEEEVKDPYMVIDELFDFAYLPRIRDIYWDWLKATVTKTYDTLSKKEREDMVILYEKLEKLVEAVHVLHKGRKY